MSTVVKDLGAVSAYAYAVEKGYTGTEAEFAELMASYATVGQTAVDAKDAAVAAKTAAQTAATTATNKASEATTAAQTATTKAGEASQSASQAQASAQTASTKASEASASASTATAKATEATTAATSANTARTDAVAAKTAAETAQGKAETAQGAAEDAAQSVSASAAQIATNTADITDLKEDLNAVKDMESVSVFTGSYEVGSLNTDGLPYASGYAFRVRSSTFEPTSVITVNIADGFKTYWYYYSDQSGTTVSHKASSGAWITGSYTIQTTYPYYKVIIARVTEVASETADVTEFSESLTVNTSSVLIETVNSNTLRIEQLEQGTLPDYWLTYLEEKVEDLTSAKANIANHGDYFVFFTDYHAPQNKGYTADILRYISEHAEIGFNICGGDILTTHTKSEAISVLSNFQSDFEGLDLFNLQGNHEQNPYASSSADKLNNWEYYPFLFKNEERNPAVSMTKYGYYYLDNDAQKIRYIFLNTKYSVTQFSIDITQGNWFISVLNSVPDGYGVVVLTHWFFGTVNADYTLTIDGIGTRIKEICDGYANRATGTSAGIETAYDIHFDFTNAHGNMICIICGHTHNDYSIVSDAGYPIIGCMCDAYQGSNQNPIYPRTSGTYNEQAIDVFFIDTTGKTINTIRIGAGATTRNWTYT